MAVARCFPSNVLPLLQLRIPIVEMRNEFFLPLCFRANFQQALANGHIHRQFGGHMVGELNAALGFKARRVFPVKNLVTLVAELLQPFGNSGIEFREILLEIFDVRF